MANATMYSKKDKVYKRFPITCTPSKEACKECPLKFNCDKKEE